ncbi:GGDEF domain-containing protein [Deinococcus peraridilitoris]|uniref:GGDEF domain-containing protein n=1 Tax=Deinococcus peraridilitoris TaxID=432329 RepID=UPI00030C4FBD|nr:GGDEF domain-containing protein [Deinococcus peraridilitoris]
MQARIQRQDARSAAELALLHRDAAYFGLDLNDQLTAMRHALFALEFARVAGDRSLQAKAHVTLALVQAEAYDDLGAEQQFSLAEELALEAGDDRGMALIAVNRSHVLMQRREYARGVEPLRRLLRSPHAVGLQAPENAGMAVAFHINYTVCVAEALLQGRQDHLAYPELHEDFHRAVTRLQEVKADPTFVLGNPLDTLEILDALARHAQWRGESAEAISLADERVALAARTESPALQGAALFERGRLHARSEAWNLAIRDFEEAVLQFDAARQDLPAARARDALAGAYATIGRFREAFEVQREVTRGVEQLYRDVYQQRARLDDLQVQAREAEVRASAFAEAALRDSLTGAPNRARAMQVLGTVHQLAQGGTSSAVALMDLDHFKQVNDTFGHAAGDVVLQRVVEVLSGAIREVDCLARFGGEEFVLIFAGVTVREAEHACARLLERISSIDWSDVDARLHVTASFGVAAVNGVRGLKETLQAADEALYAAKAAGRARVRVAGEI